MSALNNAKKFFEACESAQGWESCKEYVEDGATFTAQADAMGEVSTVEGYTEFMKQIGGVTLAGATYTLHAESFDENTRTATFFGTYHATHVGEGPPIPPTNKTTNSHYVYALKMSDNNKVVEMTKIWNDRWCFRELGWAE
ncbi:uncharacterized protein METZ01_LOCUS484519 [marine metagenome]|uniref:SnoaL-like domain-containing protein n=1 Tax=marine metagenome TaxID=408172 RepID=A0A383CIU2_9ZZZZ